METQRLICELDNDELEMIEVMRDWMDEILVNKIIDLQYTDCAFKEQFDKMLEPLMEKFY